MNFADLFRVTMPETVLEVAALGKPALLVPYPYATADHQMKNARWMADAGAAEVIEDSALDAAELAGRVEALLGDRELLGRMASASAALGRRDGAASVAAEVFNAATG